MRVIDQLRQLFTGAWHYSSPVWVHEGGWNVRRDLARATRAYFRRSDSGALIYLGTCVNLEFPV
jgi:hypothetical protein